MATKKISELDAGEPLDGTELLEIVQDGENRQIAVQAIVDQASGSSTAPPLTVTGQAVNYTAVLSDAGGYVRMNLATAGTFTVPPNSGVAFATGSRLYVEQRGAGVVTITPGSGVTIRSRGAVYNTGGQYAVAVLVKVDTDTWVLSGDVA